MNRHRHHSHHKPLALPHEIEKVVQFHASLPGYFQTPLIPLESLSEFLGLTDVLVKDEAHRLGLNSFKVLGSSYALMHYLEGNPEPFPRTFATATDGNHGLGLAWSAKQFKQKAVVFMPRGSSSFRLDKIREMGARAEVTDFNYDDTVRHVGELSKRHGWILMQDTLLEELEIPLLIMQGYLTIVWELLSQITTLKKRIPTHIILQGGVGSFAGALIDGFKQFIDTSSMTFIIVEPHEADCIFQSGCSADGSLKKASGNLSTMMAGLSCGEANPLAWDIIKSTAACFITCSDDIAANGMRIFGRPLGKDPRIISGESGAVPLGLLVEICKNPQLKDLKKELGFSASSRVLFINTEGDTDPQNYKKILGLE